MKILIVDSTLGFYVGNGDSGGVALMTKKNNILKSLRPYPPSPQVYDHKIPKVWTNPQYVKHDLIFEKQRLN